MPLLLRPLKVMAGLRQHFITYLWYTTTNQCCHTVVVNVVLYSLHRLCSRLNKSVEQLMLEMLFYRKFLKNKVSNNFSSKV